MEWLDLVTGNTASCDDITKLGLCDWFTNELNDWRRRKEITYETLGYHLVQKINIAILVNRDLYYVRHG